MTPAHHRLNLSAGIASVAVALTLVALKLWAFAVTGALSIAASLADSGLDLMISLGGFAAIFYVARLLSPAPPVLAAETAGIAVMALSILLTAALVLWQRHVARRTGNRVVAADALHYLSDLLPSLGAILSLVAAALWGIGQIDAVVALATSGLLAVGALRIGRGAWDALMDRAVDPEVVAGIEAIARDWPGIAGYHDLRTRAAGSRVFVNLHVEIDGQLSLTEAHDIGAGLKHAILRAYPQADVIIHKDPVRGT